MTELPKPPALAARGGCWFEAGAARLHLGIEPDFRASKKAHPGLRVHGLDAFAARLTAAGAPSPGTTSCRATGASTRPTRWATVWNSWRHWTDVVAGP